MDLRQEARRWADRDEKPKAPRAEKPFGPSWRGIAKAVGWLFAGSLSWQAASGVGVIAGYALSATTLGAMLGVRRSASAAWRQKSAAVFHLSLAAQARVVAAELRQIAGVAAAAASQTHSRIASAANGRGKSSLRAVAWAIKAIEWRTAARGFLSGASEAREKAADDAAVAMGPRAVWMRARRHLADERADRAAALFLRAPFDPRWPAAGHPSFAEALAAGAREASLFLRSDEESRQAMDAGVSAALALREGIELRLALKSAASACSNAPPSAPQAQSGQQGQGESARAALSSALRDSRRASARAVNSTLSGGEVSGAELSSIASSPAPNLATAGGEIEGGPSDLPKSEPKRGAARRL